MEDIRKNERIAYVLDYCIDTAEIVPLYNEMKETIGGNLIYRMVDFDEVMQGRKPMDLVIYTKKYFTPNERFFYEDSLGQIISFDEIGDSNCPIKSKELAEYMVSHNTGLDELENALIESYCQEVTEYNQSKFENALRDYLKKNNLKMLEINWHNLELTIGKEYFK